jgi:pimeloyl-ACP methyl ester carboxylesterase
MQQKENLNGTRIDKKERLTIGGIPQWISLRSENIKNPIILFLHGGPGTAQIFLPRKPQKRLEDSFLVINWDQRGAGRSYSPSLRDAGVQRNWLSNFHGAAYEGTLQSTILKNISIRDVRPFDIIRFIAGAIFSLSTLEDEQNKVKIIRDVPEMKVPVYFCCGRRDYNTPFELVVEYDEKLTAPKKEIIWYEHSAHLPNFEEPEKFCDFCKSLLNVS